MLNRNLNSREEIRFKATHFTDGSNAAAQPMFWLNDKEGWITTTNLSNAPNSTFIRKTVDGGESWSEPVVILDGSINPSAAAQTIYFLDSLNGVLGLGNASFDATDIASVRKTSDGGTTWTPCTALPVTNRPLGVCSIVMYTSDNWSVLGSSGGWATYTTNAGVTWAAWAKPGGDATFLTNQVKISSTVGFACGTISGGIKIWKTTNAGQTWVASKTVTAISSAAFSYISAIGTDFIYACGRNGGSSNAGVGFPLFVKSVDGGANWTEVLATSNKYGTNFTLVEFRDTSIGYATSSATAANTILNFLWKTTNGGLTWKMVMNLTRNNILQAPTSIRYNANMFCISGYKFAITGGTSSAFYKAVGKF